MLRTQLLPLTFTACLMLSVSASADTDFSCPESPNCVSSQATGDHYIVPLQLPEKTPEETIKSLQNILENWPRMAVTRVQGNEIHAIATSKWFRFKDDLTLRVNDDGSIDVKSASRTGYSDLGVNRERVETLRKQLTTNE